MNPSTLEASKIPTSESSVEISPNNSCVISMSQIFKIYYMYPAGCKLSICNTCMHITSVQLH